MSFINKKKNSTSKKKIRIRQFLPFFIFLLATGPAKADNRSEQLREAYKRPESIPFPANNPYSGTKATLGKMLFFDPRLSQAKNMTCASCHNPSFGWEAPLSKPVGALAQPLKRHAPTLLNMAWSGDALFWDGRAPSLEEQARGPIETPAEMNIPLSEVVERLNGITEYRYWFDKAFPVEGLTSETVLHAIATYERTIVSTESPFDRWVNGDDTALDESEKRGFQLFNGKAGCSRCHSGWNFTDNRFHDIGLPDIEDKGRYEVTGEVKDQFSFKTPGLRNITQRAPYMHDGSLPNLESVIAHYLSGGVRRNSISPLMRPVPLNASERDDLIAFLKSLTGPDMVVSLPNLPN